MKKRNLKKSLLKLVAIALAIGTVAMCLGGCSNNGSGNQTKQKVTIFSANYEEQILLQKDYLQGLFPDAEITIEYLSSGKLASKLLAEGDATEIEIALSLSSGYANQMKEAGRLRAYQPETNYKSEYSDPDNMILPNGVWSGAMLVNTEELDKLGLPMPTSFADLLDPVYKGHIVMSNPNSSSTGYFFLHGILNYYGEQEGWEYFEKLNENIMLYGESGSIPSTMVEKGEAVIGLGIDYEGMQLEADGKPVKVVFAEEGAPYDYDTVLLINRKSEPSAFVLEIMKAITSVEGNAVFNNYNLAVLEGASDRGTYPGNFKLLDMSGIADPDIKGANSTKWSEKFE